MQHKIEVVSGYIEKIGASTVWDLGANTGEFSRIAADSRAMTVAFDVDPAATERHYIDCKTKMLGRTAEQNMKQHRPLQSPGVLPSLGDILETENRGGQATAR